MIHYQCKRFILVDGLDTWKEWFKFSQFPPTQHTVYNSLIVLFLDYEWKFCFQLWFYALGSSLGILNIDAWIPLQICLILHLKRLIASDKKTSEKGIKLLWKQPDMPWSVMIIPTLNNHYIFRYYLMFNYIIWMYIIFLSVYYFQFHNLMQNMNSFLRK
jgi:hypothetical protein